MPISPIVPLVGLGLVAALGLGMSSDDKKKPGGDKDKGKGQPPPEGPPPVQTALNLPPDLPAQSLIQWPNPTGYMLQGQSPWVFANGITQPDTATAPLDLIYVVADQVAMARPGLSPLQQNQLLSFAQWLKGKGWGGLAAVVAVRLQELSTAAPNSLPVLYPANTNMEPDVPPALRAQFWMGVLLGSRAELEKIKGFLGGKYPYFAASMADWIQRFPNPAAQAQQQQPPQGFPVGNFPIPMPQGFPQGFPGFPGFPGQPQPQQGQPPQPQPQQQPPQGFPQGFPGIPGFPGFPGQPQPQQKPPAAQLPPGAFLAPDGGLRYTLQNGDYGTKIAVKFGKSNPDAWVPSMTAANPEIKDWSKQPAGKVIRLPLSWADPTAQPPGKGDPLLLTPPKPQPGQGLPPVPGIPAVPPGWPVPQQQQQAPLPQLPPGAAWAQGAQGPEVRYTVQAGDYPAKILKKFGKTEADIPALRAANPQISNWNAVKVGQVIRIP